MTGPYTNTLVALTLGNSVGYNDVGYTGQVGGLLR